MDFGKKSSVGAGEYLYGRELARVDQVLYRSLS